MNKSAVSSLVLMTSLIACTASVQASGFSRAPSSAPPPSAPPSSRDLQTPTDHSRYNSNPQNFHNPSARQQGAAAPEVLDKQYEYGKHIYSGRYKPVGKINYCVDTGKDKVKIKEKTIQLFRGRSVQQLADSIYDCDSPNIQVSNYMKEQHYSLVLYYLNKRYGLGLKN